MHENLKEWLSRLCCPLCRGELELQEQSLRCTACQQEYPIVDGIPDLVPPEDEN